MNSLEDMRSQSQIAMSRRRCDVSYVAGNRLGRIESREMRARIRRKIGGRGLEWCDHKKNLHGPFARTCSPISTSTQKNIHKQERESKKYSFVRCIYLSFCHTDTYLYIYIYILTYLFIFMYIHIFKVEHASKGCNAQ